MERLVADAERAIENQIRAGEQEDVKAAQMIRLAVAMLAGAITIALFVGGNPEVDSSGTFAAAFGLGLLTNLAAVSLFVDSYLGTRHPHETYSAPDVQWLAAKVGEPELALDDHFSSLVFSYAAYSEANLARLKWSAGRRRRGLHVLLGAVSAYVVSVVLIAGGLNTW